MAQDLVGLFNLALSAIGTRSIVATPNEESREAEICNLWYPTVRDQVLRSAPWSSARGTARLALLKERDFDLDWEEGDPEPPWTFVFAQPSDMLYPRHLDSFQQFQLGIRRFTVNDVLTQTPAIYAHAETPLFVYTFRQDKMNYWDADLYSAVAQALAAAIALPLHGKAGRAQLAMESANNAIIQARVNAANESMTQLDHVPDWLAARGVSSTSSPSGYVYPNAPLLTPATFATSTIR